MYPPSSSSPVGPTEPYSSEVDPLICSLADVVVQDSPSEVLTVCVAVSLPGAVEDDPVWETALVSIADVIVGRETVVEACALDSVVSAPTVVEEPVVDFSDFVTVTGGLCEDSTACDADVDPEILTSEIVLPCSSVTPDVGRIDVGLSDVPLTSCETAVADERSISSVCDNAVVDHLSKLVAVSLAASVPDTSDETAVWEPVLAVHDDVVDDPATLVDAAATDVPVASPAAADVFGVDTLELCED